MTTPSESAPDTACLESAGAEPVALITEVAALIPAPTAALCLDDPSWAAFDGLLSDAARLVATAVGARGLRLLRDLAASSVGDDLVQSLLVERTIGQLDGHRL
ncbi:hypothetical protein [Nocardioides panacihumi]|uniref:hypothetical protein n=1 Tax=Nocardioides panacihumi TaxID=400774 RepID=UPI0031DB9F26